MWSWSMLSSKRYLCLWQGVVTRWSLSSFLTQTVLWVYVSMILQTSIKNVMAAFTPVKRTCVHFLTLDSKDAESTHHTDELSCLSKQTSTKLMLRILPGTSYEAYSGSVREAWITSKSNSRHRISNSVLFMIVGHYLILALFNFLICSVNASSEGYKIFNC